MVPVTTSTGKLRIRRLPPCFASWRKCVKAGVLSIFLHVWVKTTMLFEGTFDTTNALASMFLWIIFSYLAIMLNCDLQRFMISNLFFFHFMGYLAFFFLFTVLDPNNNSSIFVIYLKTLVVYLLFLCLVKSKWYFILPILILLLVDQSIKKEYSFRKEKDPSLDTNVPDRISLIITYIIVGLILIGTIHYAIIQVVQHKQDFSIIKFFFSVKRCVTDDASSCVNSCTHKV